MARPQNRQIKVGRINARYWDEGGGSDTIILIHGLTRSVDDWLPCLEALAKGNRVIAVDLPGHGLTDKPPEATYSVAALARFIKDFMIAVKVDQAHIVGHSLGGAIATRYAILFPEATQSLTLINSAGLGRGCDLLLRFCNLRIIGELLTRPSRVSSATTLRMSVYDQSIVTKEIIDEAYHKASMPGIHQAFLKTVRANFSIYGQAVSMYGPNTKGLGDIACPVLIVWGRQDKIIPVGHAVAAAKCLPDARLRIYEACGHVPMLEHYQDFNDLMIDFIRSPGPATSSEPNWVASVPTATTFAAGADYD